jgi:hypothetical protein
VSFDVVGQRLVFGDERVDSVSFSLLLLFNKDTGRI